MSHVALFNNPKNKEEIQPLIDAFLEKGGILRHIWCNRKDYPDAFDVGGYPVIPKGGCRSGTLMFFGGQDDDTSQLAGGAIRSN